MQITRVSALIAAVAATSLLLTACGSNNNTTTTPSTTAPTSDTSVGSSTVVATTSSAMTSSSDTAMTSKAPTGAAATFAGSGFTCATGTLRSSGSTAQGSVMAKWINDYNAKCGATINAYGGGGSGKGVTDFTSNQTDFGGSDSPFSADQLTAAKSRCGGGDAIDLPMVTGPISVSYNLAGVSKLILTPKLLVGIFGGAITNWNDKMIGDANPGVTLPTLAIATIHRSESSGTTDNFTKYLTAAGGWTFAGGKSWTAPGGTGAQGSDGVAKAVASTTGGIGYVEWGFAKQANLSYAEIDNGGGAVALTAESAGAGVASAKIVGTGKDLALKLDYAATTAGAYPVILVTNELVCSTGNGAKAALLKSFLGWTATDGQAELSTLGAAPLPAGIQAKVIDAVKALA